MLRNDVLRSVHQGVLVEQLKVLFPAQKPKVNVRKEFKHKYTSESSLYLELDVWFPEYDVCFEFQDDYHYVNSWYNQEPTQTIQRKDNIKEALVRQSGLSLIVVPCWWDGSSESLAASIHFQRPDLPQGMLGPISANPPISFFKEINIPNVGELMYASFATDVDSLYPFEWWVGEKYDGIRFCWNPHTRKAYSRQNNEFLLFKVCHTIPPVMVDGELWFGRQQFSLAHVFYNQANFEYWHLLRMMAFDSPTNGQNNPFEARYKLVLTSIDTFHPVLIVATRLLREQPTSDELNKLLHIVIEDGGEGVILRKCRTQHERGRSASLVKLKATNGDREGLVVGLNRKSVRLQLPNGVTFTVPAENVYISTPSIGSVVTFSYESNARRTIPVGPKVIRIRPDIIWDNVVDQFYKDNALSSSVPFTDHQNHEPNKRGLRSYLETLARSRKLDPLSADTWHRISVADLRKKKRGRYIMKRFNGLTNAIRVLFPEINFKSENSTAKWRDVGNRRHAFELYAKKQNFDHLIPSNWYSQTIQHMTSIKGLRSLISYHGASVSKALSDLFPEITFDKSKWALAWQSPYSRRFFFEKYAQENGFDPLNPEMWRRQSRSRILDTEGAVHVLSFHSGSVPKALLELFPEIGLKWTRTWYTPSQRRVFFENFAATNGFDPLKATNWYLQTREKILAATGAAQVLSFYKNSISEALADVFPDIGIDKQMWTSSWITRAKRRDFFISYAKEHGFDPQNPKHWYLQPEEKIMCTKGALQVIAFHNHSILQALCDLFPDIGLHKTHWNSPLRLPINQQKFFVQYATHKAFDPYIPENWYMQPKYKIMATKQAVKVAYYHNTISSALCNLFPNIGLEPHKLLWDENNTRENSRKLFEDFAKCKCFDPLNPSNWIIPKYKITSLPGFIKVLSYYDNNITLALLDLFPEIEHNLVSKLL